MSSGSEKRVRKQVLPIRLAAEERAKIEEDATRAGLATGTYARQVLLGAPTPRQVRRPVVEKQELARLLGELGKVGGNLNQLAKSTNQGFMVYQNEILLAVGGLNVVRAEILKALGRSS